eukprot:TRINITY_DN14534_c0_g1_i15.p1 TRINITY_DN14534_c0_g1~~TRINITY_DN14534_c0_g1_i15.p1  ORF type:complete len:2071 (-),score=477.87 TRINITY_DN14534_c0_g1_i15:114-6200(-)
MLRSLVGSEMCIRDRCKHAPEDNGGGTAAFNWEWTTDGPATRCLTIDDTKVTKTYETDGDYHIVLGPEFSHGNHSWSIHVGHNSNMQMGMCDKLVWNQHPTNTKDYAVVWDCGGSYYEYEDGNQKVNKSIGSWSSGDKVDFTYNSHTGVFTMSKAGNQKCETTIKPEFMNTIRFYVSIDYVNEWIRLDDHEMTSGGSGGNLDPFSELFSPPADKVLEKMTVTRDGLMRAAKQELTATSASSTPIDALVGYHSGLFGPCLSDSVRKEAAKRLTKAVRSFTRAQKDCEPMALILENLSSEAKTMCNAVLKASSKSAAPEKKATQNLGPHQTANTMKTAMFRMMLSMVSTTVMTDHTAVDQIMTIIDSALVELTPGSLAKASPLRPKEFSSDLLDSLTEFLSSTLLSVQSVESRKRVGKTITQWAILRGDFRNHAAALDAKRRTGIPEMTSEADTDMRAILHQVVVPCLDAGEETIAPIALAASEFLQLLLVKAVMTPEHSVQGSDPSFPEQWPEQSAPTMTYSSLGAACLLTKSLLSHLVAAAGAAPDTWLASTEDLYAGLECSYGHTQTLLDKLAAQVPAPNPKHLTNFLDGLLVPVSQLKHAATSITLTRLEALPVQVQLQVAIVVQQLVQATLRQAVSQQLGLGAPAEGEAPLTLMARSKSLELDRQAVTDASRDILSKLAARPPIFKSSELRTPWGHPATSPKKGSKQLGTGPTLEYKIIDPCNSTFKFVTHAVQLALAKLGQTPQPQEETEDFIRLLRLGTLNLRAWTQKKEEKELKGRALGATSIPGQELLGTMFDTARQTLSFFSNADDDLFADSQTLPLLIRYATAFLQETIAIQYTNAPDPSGLLMTTISTAGLGGSDSITPILPGCLPLNPAVGRVVVDAMCSNINNPITAARLFKGATSKNPLLGLDSADDVVAMTESFLNMLHSDLTTRLDGSQDADFPMPIISSVVAQIQLALWARNSQLASDPNHQGPTLSSLHQFALLYAEHASKVLKEALRCQDLPLLATALNRSVYALTLPAFTAFTANLHWDVSDDTCADQFENWMEAMTRLASCVESLIQKLPDLDLAVQPSLRWQVTHDAGVNVRTGPSLSEQKAGTKLLKGVQVRVTETRSQDGEWVKLDNYENLDVAWARFKSPKDTYIVPIVDPTAQSDVTASCPWLNTSLSVLLYFVGRQTLTPHPNELKRKIELKDTCKKWIKSSLFVGGPTEQETEQLKSLLHIEANTDPEIRDSKLQAVVSVFEPSILTSAWWEQCKPRAADDLSPTEIQTVVIVFEALLHHAGLGLIALSEVVPDEIVKCAEAAVQFLVQSNANYSTMNNDAASNNLRSISFKAELLRFSLEPAFKPYKTTTLEIGSPLVRTKSKLDPLLRSKSQIGYMKNSELEMLDMLDLSQSVETQDLALQACIDEVFKFLQDTKVNVATLISELVHRVSRAKTRVIRLSSALHWLHQGTHNRDRRMCTEMLLLRLNDAAPHFLHSLNGCGRALRHKITDLWHQCIEVIALPLINDPCHSTRMAALTAMSTVWDDHDLSFLTECDIWTQLKSLIEQVPEDQEPVVPEAFKTMTLDDLKQHAVTEMGMVLAQLKDKSAEEVSLYLAKEQRDSAVSSSKEVQSIGWALMTQLALISFCKKAPSVQLTSWRRYSIDSIASIIQSSAGTGAGNQIFGLVSLCIPSSLEPERNRDSKELLVQLLTAIKPLLSCVDLPEVETEENFYLPEGILTDQPASILSGWDKYYEESYREALSNDGAEMVPSSCDYVAFGAKHVATQKIVLVAFGDPKEVFKETSDNNTNLHNGVHFYRSASHSMGFAPSDNISLSNADTTDRDDTKRLSLHCGQNCGGWRAGANCSIDSSDEYVKFVYTRSQGTKAAKPTLRVLGLFRKLVLQLGPMAADRVLCGKSSATPGTQVLQTLVDHVDLGESWGLNKLTEGAMGEGLDDPLFGDSAAYEGPVDYETTQYAGHILSELALLDPWIPAIAEFTQSALVPSKILPTKQNMASSSFHQRLRRGSVSYTHLTLPTKRIV